MEFRVILLLNKANDRTLKNQSTESTDGNDVL